MPKEKFSDYLKPGWLKRQCKQIEKDALTWPDWMLEESGMVDIVEKKKRLIKAKQKRVIKSINEFMKLYFPNQYAFMVKEKAYKEMIDKIKKEINGYKNS